MQLTTAAFYIYVSASLLNYPVESLIGDKTSSFLPTRKYYWSYLPESFIRVKKETERDKQNKQHEVAAKSNTSEGFSFNNACSNQVFQYFEGFKDTNADFTALFGKALSYATMRTVVFAALFQAIRMVAPDPFMKLIQHYLISLGSFMENTIGSLQRYVLYLIIYMTSQLIKASILCVCLPAGILLLAAGALARKISFLEVFQDILQWVYAAIKDLYFTGTTEVNERAQDLMSNSLFFLWDWDKSSLSGVAGNWILIALSLAIFAPLCEEVVIRGIIQPILSFLLSTVLSWMFYLNNRRKDRQPLDLIQQPVNVITSILFAAGSISTSVYQLIAIRIRSDLDGQVKAILLWGVILWGIFQSTVAFYLSRDVFSRAKNKNGLSGAIGSHSAWNINLYLLFSYRIIWEACSRAWSGFRAPRSIGGKIWLVCRLVLVCIILTNVLYSNFNSLVGT